MPFILPWTLDNVGFHPKQYRSGRGKGHQIASLFHTEWWLPSLWCSLALWLDCGHECGYGKLIWHCKSCLFPLCSFLDLLCTKLTIETMTDWTQYSTVEYTNIHSCESTTFGLIILEMTHINDTFYACNKYKGLLSMELCGEIGTREVLIQSKDCSIWLHLTSEMVGAYDMHIRSKSVLNVQLICHICCCCSSLNNYHYFCQSSLHCGNIHHLSTLF